MKHHKEANRDTYKIKLVHLKKEKQNRFTPSFHQDNFGCFATMTPQSLLNFMEEKYQIVAQKNTDVIAKINRAIIERICILKKQFHAKNKQEFMAFINEATGLKVTDQKYQQIFKQNCYQFSPFFTRLNRSKFKGIYMTKVQVNWKDRQQKKTRYFYTSELPKQWDVQFSFKRLKKQVIEFLSNFIELISNIEECQAQMNS